MAKKYYDGDITLNTDWGGDASTGGLPVVGSKVQEIIKGTLNSKVGYVGRVEKTGQGFYVLSRDEETFNKYLETITDSNPFGDLTMDGINGRFDAPFNYKMNISLVNPESGYKSTLVGSTGNVIKFTAQTVDANDTPQGESLTITFKIITEGGVENTYTAIYDGNTAAKGIEYNLDGKLSAGQNTIVITAVGMNTGISAMRRITYRLIDMSFIDKFDIAKRYQFLNDGSLTINVGYALKGVGRTRIIWYFDGNLYATDTIANSNPNLQNANRSFYFTKGTDQWLTTGIHNIQVSMICTDTDSQEEFQTPIYYREFIVEDTPATLKTPYIVRKASFDYEKGWLTNGETPTIYDVKQFENTNIEYAVYYNGKSECDVITSIAYNNLEPAIIASETLPMVSDGFSTIQHQTINLVNEGYGEIILTAPYGTDEKFETKFKLEIGSSDMNITTVTDSIALSLSAFGRSNNSADKESWEYITEKGKVITTEFSKNEYVVISTRDEIGNVMVPSDSTEENTISVTELPTLEVEDIKYILYNEEYYVWNREFDWSNTSGWADNKLKLANGNAITINYQPFSADKLTNLKERGGTFEFEFETTNVYNDDAVICRVCGNKNYAPGITIYASGSELVISREVDKPEYDEEGNLININAGYIKAVSTKYKSEESNRISFVITPDAEVNADGTEYRDRILKIYVNGELCGAYPYDKGTSFLNTSKITFRGSEEACVNISSIQIYERALSSNEILGNYIYYRTDTNEKAEVYKRNNVMLDDNDEAFDSDKLKSQLGVMMFYQIDPNQSLDDIHQEKKNKKLTRFFDVVYIDINNPSKNFLVKNAYVTPQGTSSMNYPVKNLRLYTGKKDDAGNYYSRLFVGSNIFIDGSPNNLSWENINLETEVGKKRLYSFRDETSSQKAAAPVNCWCLKADFAESSSSHNTGTARFWNNVLKSAGFTTKAQAKAAKYSDLYPYDVRTCVDGFPIVVFYQPLDGSTPRFEGKYNFNNDKSTESVFGFTGGEDVEDQEVKYFYIGTNRPIIQSETDKETGEVTYACSWSEGGYTETPTVDSPLYTSDNNGNWYMLRGKELLDNPKMECWELLNSVSELALFKTAKNFTTGDGDEKVGLELENGFDEAFESRYPDCGDYYHYNSLKRFVEWLVSCRYLDIDKTTGESVPFSQVPLENYDRNEEGKLKICSLSKKTGSIAFDFPNVNFYKEVDYESIKSNIKNEGYQAVEITDNDILASLEYREVTTIPTVKDEEYEYLLCNGLYYTWLPSNLLEVDSIPNIHETSYDYVLVDGKYYAWNNMYNLEDYHEPQYVEDSAFNRALKFAIEKYDHIDMDKMAAYYIYLMRFGGVDQTVKNSMLTTEGPATDNPSSTLPSLWYFINYDNDTILGVKNDGRLVFDPYITRQTKDGTGYVYAGRESTLWNNLEADIQFMETVTKVDNVLAKGEGNSLYALSFENAIREYDTNQSDKWCERIYNKDAERKYIQTYVEGWTQKIAASGTTNHVYEDYLYDVHGSRSAHRKWWLGRRFNVFDSKFCNTNFMNSLIKFRSTNLPAGSQIKIKSGEPIFYAWGHDNTVTEMTPTAIQPGDTYTFTTKSAFNIGSYLELMGAANIATLDLRDCVGALTEIDVTGCYSYSVGTKMKEIIVGDHTRADLVNVSNTSMKFSGLDKASKLEYLDVTNIKNVMALDGLNTLLNIREVYAKGTSIANLTFADGALIETIEAPSTIQTLSLTRSSLIGYDGITFEDEKYGNLTNLTIDNCAQLMDNPDFVINWIGSKTPAQRANLSLNLQGIDWTFDINNYSNLYLLEDVGTAAMSPRRIRGVIEITARLDISDVVRLKRIFGEGCFNEGSEVYIKAPTGLYVSGPDVLWEGSTGNRFEITTVGTTLSGQLYLSAMVNEIIDGQKVPKIISATNGIVTMDEATLNNGYVYVNVQESDNVYSDFVLTATYVDEVGYEREGTKTSMVNKRIYPNSIAISTVKDSYNNKTPNTLRLTYLPDSVNNTNLEGRGFFNVKWEMISGSTGYENSLQLTDTDKEVAYIQAPKGFDGTVMIGVTITKNYNSEVVGVAEKELEFTNPDTIITRFSNEPLYNILVSAGIIKEDASGFGKLTKYEAAMLTMGDLLNKNKKSIFAGNTSLTSFIEFQYFNNTLMGQMPNEAFPDQVVTPDGMFEGCINLKEIALSDNFKYSAKNMFKGCSKLEYIYGPQVSEDKETGEPIYTNLAIEYVGDSFALNCTSLKSCLLSAVAKYIGHLAFSQCKQLGDFQVPTSPDLKMVYDSSNTPFKGCLNINFKGAEYGGVSEAKYKVFDGACYEIDSINNRLNLIHLGKNSLVSNIPSDKMVYACSQSMEYRTEENIVVPENVVFNGQRIFTGSAGNSMELTSPLGNSVCAYLFAETQYNGNYKFAENETYLPQDCFYGVTDMTSFDVPEGVTRLSSQCFYGCTKLATLRLPSTLTTIDSQSFWLSAIKNIYFFGEMPPTISDDDFFGVTPDAMFVLPEYYDNYKTHLMHLIAPFVTPMYPYNEGYLRIIKDGEFLFSDNDEVKITIGDIPVETVDGDDYMIYQNNDKNQTLDVLLNDEVIGQIAGKYTTIYLGDNSSLFEGEGLNFCCGINDADLKTEIEKSGWFYDPRFNGIRSKQNLPTGEPSEFTVTIPHYSNVSMPIKYGKYAYNNAKVYGYVKNSANETLLQTPSNTNGYGMTGNIVSNNGLFKVGYVRGESIKTGIDGFIINEMGTSVYSDPEIPNYSTFALKPNKQHKMVTVVLNAPIAIPENVCVTITDGKSHTYSKLWKGEPLMFTLPEGYSFNIYATTIVTENGKVYTTAEVNNINTDYIELSYEGKTGMEILNNVLCYYDDTTDWYVNLERKSDVWSSINVVTPEVAVDEILTSDADGYINTIHLAQNNPNGIFDKALNDNILDNNIKWFIPSYIELELFSCHLTEINEYLKQQKKTIISLEDCWTSEEFDSNNAWTSDGQCKPKNTKLSYYIFGKQIMN